MRLAVWIMAGLSVALGMLAAFVPCCASQQIGCNVTSTSGGTHYSVQNSAGSRCYYDWTNTTDHVLANKDGNLDELVVTSNISGIHIRGCLEVVKYKRSCLSSETGTPTAVCYATCKGGAAQDNTGTPLETHDISPTTIFIIVVVVAVLLTIAVLCFIYRGKLCEWVKRRYTAVSDRPADNDVERGL